MLKNKIQLIEVVAFFGALSIFGLSFDGFWHLTRGRESFFILPHLFVYSGLIGSILASYRAFRLTKDKNWKHIFTLLCIIALTAPVDELFHRWFGKETIDQVSIVWSAPHIVFLISGIAALFKLALVIREEKAYKARNTLGPVVIGLALSALMIGIGPLSLFGIHQVIGAAGLGAWAALLIFILFISKRLFPNPGSALLTAATALILQSVVFDAGSYIPEPYQFFHAPLWLFTIIFMLPAFVIENTKTKGMITGMFTGLSIAFAFFILLASTIPDQPFVYMDAWIGCVSAGVGGLIAGLINEMVDIKKED